MPFNKTRGWLQLQVPWPPCHHLGKPPEREARFRKMENRTWVQVMCKAVKDEDDSVTCPLGVGGTFEVQLRHKPPHWSSYWSDWSSSIFVPEEILESPELSFQLGKLGRDGQRVLRLSWQRVPEDRGDVTYTLQARMPACGCAQGDEEDTVVLGTEHNLTLSGAEYQILLTAANDAGPGPARHLLVPAEQRTGTGPTASPRGVIFPAIPHPPPHFIPDLSFKDIGVTGDTVTARWEAPNPGSASCFEQQPLPGAPRGGVCTQEDFPANSIHVEQGTLEAPGCHRLAVHSREAARGWATVAVTHHYASNASLAIPIRANASAKNATVVLHWSPSPRAACPGVLAKYLICHAAEGDNVTYDEAEATASHYTLQNLRPGTAYRVGIWEVTTEREGTCHAWWHFQTKALGPQGAPWKSHLKYLSIILALPTAAAIYHLSKRARHLLFPPLPEPVGSKAIQFCMGETSQDQPCPGFLEPSEKFSTAELLLPEPNTSVETPMDASTRPGTPQPSLVTGEPAVVTCLEVTRPVVTCPEELPFAYCRQEVLSPVRFPEPSSTSDSGHPPDDDEEEEEEGEEGRRGLHKPLVPITLLISDKPITIRDEEEWDPLPGWNAG
ncbi:interleukin-12 receptor subunit beta-1 [Calypte anna]|uniref:interleukin-12 receptor subunit beta-1 n=1 Tax=Calypte anna TaxID=9244 RepID=UPI0011C35CF9|nr:interleukin-12 receptor subunit beta-1 [Calypte anna]